MLPFAAAYRARLILVNRRDYPGSTPFSDTELASLGSGGLRTRAKALAQQGLDIGLFLAWLVREENTPPVSIDRDGNRRGGHRSRTHPWWGSSPTQTHFRQTLGGLSNHVSEHIASLVSASHRHPVPADSRTIQFNPIRRSPPQQMRRTCRSGFQLSASTTRWWTRRIRWRNASRASIPGYLRTTRIRTLHAGRATRLCSTQPLFRILRRRVPALRRST